MKASYLPNPPNGRIREIYAWDRPTAGCYAPHYHDHAEIMCILEGRVILELDYRQYTFEKGDAILLFPRQIHRFLEPWGASHTYTFVFKTGSCPNYTQLFEAKRPESPVIQNAADIPTAVLLMETILAECAEETAYSDQITMGALQMLLGLLLRRCRMVNRGNMDETTASRIFEYCHAHFLEKITLTSAAEALDLSPYYLSHLLPQKYGIRFNELISALRLEEAVLLIHNGQKISSAAQNAGFSTVRAFNRAFQRQYGTSPTVYLGLR